MKSKIIAAIMAITMLVGCSNTSNTSSGVATGSQSTPTQSSSAGKGQYANRLEKIKAEGKLILATSPDYAPYEFEDIRKSGQEAIVGADVELARHIAKGLGVELVIEPMDFGALVASITEGKADIAISGMAPKPERAMAMELSTTFNKGNGFQGVMSLTANKDKYKTVADLKGKKIAVQNGSLQYDLTSQQVEDAQIEYITSLTDGIMMLKAGKVDVMSIPSTTGFQFVANYPELAMTDAKYEYESVGSVAGMQKGQVELLEAVNKLIEEAETTGMYATWVDEALALSNELGAKK